MDIINKLRNYFIGLLIISVGLTAWVILMEANNLKLMYVDDSLINTFIASSYAVTIAVFIYWRQQKDKYETLKTSLKLYLIGLIDYYKSDKSKSILNKKAEKDHILSFNQNFINEIIVSGYFSDNTQELIKLQINYNVNFILYDNAINKYDYNSDEIKEAITFLNESNIYYFNKVLSSID